MKIAPSVLTSNFTNLKAELDSISNADLLHLDIMDGHFVPNISFGPAIAKSIEQNTHLPLDVHLMVTDPIIWVPKFASLQTRYITIHVEAHQVSETLQSIHHHHVGAGISLKPRTPVRAIMPYINEVELVLVMTVEPGFGGQSFMADMMEKVKELVQIRKENGLRFLIEVDGGINDETIKVCQAAGVDISVVGSYLFNQENRNQTIEALK